MTVKVVCSSGRHLPPAGRPGHRLREGVDKRIDVHGRRPWPPGFPPMQLQDLDLAYAPPYSSAKDPVNMAGYMVENLSSRACVRQYHVGGQSQGSARDATACSSSGRAHRARVRPPVATSTASRNIPLDELRERIWQSWTRQKPAYVLSARADFAATWPAASWRATASTRATSPAGRACTRPSCATRRWPLRQPRAEAGRRRPLSPQASPRIRGAFV